MMVSEANRSLQAPSVDAAVSVASSLPASAASTSSAAMATPSMDAGGAIAFPAALAAATSTGVPTTFGDTLVADAGAFSALPFDEQFMAMPAELAQQADPAAAAAAAAAIGASFFIDTAAIAQQIAMAVTDEKKLSDNILDLIPPPQSNVSTAATSIVVASTATTLTTHAAGAAASLTMPLGPPPGLMDMRALSPPMSLMPDFSQPSGMTALSLDAAAAAVATTAASVTPTIPVVTTVAPPAPATIAAPVTTSAAATTTAASAAAVAAAAAATAEERRRASAYAAASLLKKRKSNDAFGPDATAVSSGPIPTSSYIPPTPSVVTTPATTSVTPPTVSSSSATTPTVSAAAAANLQNLAREKVMKEPQSGDLYECVITKRNGGLGLTLACVDDHVQITGLAPDTPAANSGICVGDTLVAVSGLPVRGLQFSTVIGRLKSSSRNSVVLKLRRNPFRHNANGNGLPYRNNNGIGAGLKRPARPLTKTPESNSANVLSNSKSMALETRLAGPSAVVPATSSTASNGHDHNGTSAFHVKTEPTQSSYFPPQASILTSMSASATTAVPHWRVAEEDRDRYYAETRRLRQELSHAVSWRRRERNATGLLHQQFQEIAQKFESEMQTIFQIGAATSSAAANGTSGAGGVVDSSSVAKSHHEDLVALRQKLLEVNHALARQQTEIMELKERDARHAFHEMRRIKAEIVSDIQKRMQEVVMTGASQLKGPGEPFTKACEERIEGVRPSVFEHLFQQQSTASVASKLLASRHHHHHHHHRSSSLASTGSSGMMNVKEEKLANIELDLDAAQAVQVLTWNLRERLPARSLAVQVVGGFKIEYVTHEEALTLRYQLQLVEEKP